MTSRCKQIHVIFLAKSSPVSRRRGSVYAVLYIAAELVNHASQPAEGSLANMESCESRLSTKIVDNQLDAWLRFCVNAYKCNNTRDRGHVTACAQRRCCAASVGELCPLIVGERKDSMVTAVPLLDVLYEAWSSSLIEFAWQWLLSACLLARYNLNSPDSATRVL